jgi:hypothetical protein
VLAYNSCNKRMPDPRETIAYHEAGHAIISMKLGYKCLYVTIIPDGARLGHVCCENPLTAGDNKIEDALKVLIAASLSEAEHIGRSMWGDADDRKKAKSLALLATEQNRQRADALMTRLVDETRTLVKIHWSEINELAQRLLSQGQVNFLRTRG